MAFFGAVRELRFELPNHPCKLAALRMIKLHLVVLGDEIGQRMR
jgi:hypothetical protein